jgi:hypothetical protein
MERVVAFAGAKGVYWLAQKMPVNPLYGPILPWVEGGGLDDQVIITI